MASASSTAFSPTVSATPDSTNTDATPTGSGITLPDLNPKTFKPKNRSVQDIGQVINIVRSLQSARRDQNAKNGKIQDKANSERPYDDAKLKSEGLGYKSNFSTKPLSTTIGKVASRLTKAVQGARYLTSAELPGYVVDAKKKTEIFRAGITGLIRKWPGWYNFINEVASENSTFGWTSVAWLDEDSWKPVHFRQDKAFLPDGTKHNVDSCQFAAFTQYLMPHELAQFLRDDDGNVDADQLQRARDAGWIPENVATSINNARPPSNTDNEQAGGTTMSRTVADSLRESSVTLSMVDGAKQVLLWHVLATEIDGKVSHYIADGNTSELLFEKLDRFDTVVDCIAFYSYEQGNGLLMGSKGIGREIYELAAVVDRSRNEMIDRLQMSGKLVLFGPSSKIERFKLSVIGNVALFSDDFKPAQFQIQANAEDFIKIDSAMTQLLDQIAGGVTPRQFQGDRVTAKEVDLFASREEEKRDDIATRWITQVGAMVSQIQKKAVSASCSDEDAKAFREEMLNFMSKEELKLIASQPALQTIEDATMQLAQKIAQLAQETRNDPLYDHEFMEKAKISVLMTPEFADLAIPSQNDTRNIAEQGREQLLENLLLLSGQGVPVSERDNHEVHINLLKQGAAPVAQKAGTTSDPHSIALLSNIAQHWSDHLNALMASGADKKTLAPMVDELKQFAQHIGEMSAHAQATAQAAAQGAPAPAPQMPDGAPAPQQLAAAPSPALAPAPVAPSP